ncbi:MAG: DUF3854 domain-containing protein [Solirubrobacterales bacterium]
MTKDSRLLPQHLKLLDDSAISADVISARGYRSIETKAELEALGFSRRQSRVPALLIPIRDTTGEIATYMLRPDEPRMKGKRALKYELPTRAQMVLDVPSGARADIDDPQVPLVITEGARKADAAVSIGLCCVSLIGTWCWRGTNAKGGKVALADLEWIALNDCRPVYIAFDSDVMVKESVHAALTRLAPVLKQRGADVRYIHLPSGPKGEKVGLDDFIAHGHGQDDLLALASVDPPRIADRDSDDAEYQQDDRGITWHKGGRGRSEQVRLTNFSARITADIVIDDGVEQERMLEIQAGLAGRAREFRISAARFSPMNWVIEEVGAGAAVAPGFSLCDHARHAIQVLSGVPPERRVYAHLGWRQVGGQNIYLHAGGAIGPAEDAERAVEVEVSGALADFHLPDPPSGEDLRVAVRASLEIAELGPDAITLPLLGAIYRAPLGESDFSVFLVGPTGTFKTACAAVCQQHWGEALDERNLAESFRSTANAIEGLLFQAKDTLVVVDEFAPGGTQAEIARSHRDADRVLRSQGNRAGRARMTPDGSLKLAKRPRGLTLVTGEDVPHGQSLRSRLFVVEVEQGALDAEALSAMQEAGRTGQLAQAMAGYIRYLAEHPERRAGMRTERDELRSALALGAGHRRTPTLVADLLLGVRHLTAFGLDCDALSPEQAAKLEARARDALTTVAERQGGLQAETEPTERFRTLLNSALVSGRAHVADPAGTYPEAATAWGWRKQEAAFESIWKPSGNRIGWLKDGELYLDLEASLSAAQAVVGASGTGVAVTSSTLRKRLHERGLLASTELESRQTLAVRRQLEGRRRDVLHMASGFLDAGRRDAEPSTPPDQPDHEGEGLGSARSASTGGLTTDPTACEPPRDAAKSTAGQVGQVKKEEVRDYTRAVDNDATSGATGAHPAPDPSTTGHRPDQPDPSDRDDPDLDELDVEIARIQETFPGVLEDEW